MSGVCCGWGAVEQERPGVHSAPHTDPIPSGSRGQRLPQTTRTQLGKAEDQRCMDPGVKYKVAEWGENLKINPKDLCRKTPRKQGAAREKRTGGKTPFHSLRPISTCAAPVLSLRPNACQALQGTRGLCWDPRTRVGFGCGGRGEGGETTASYLRLDGM